MACTVLSALVSLYIQAAKTDNQPHGLWIVQRTNTLEKKNPPHINKVLQYGKTWYRNCSDIFCEEKGNKLMQL